MVCCVCLFVNICLGLLQALLLEHWPPFNVEFYPLQPSMSESRFKPSIFCLVLNTLTTFPTACLVIGMLVRQADVKQYGRNFVWLKLSLESFRLLYHINYIQGDYNGNIGIQMSLLKTVSVQIQYHFIYILFKAREIDL